MVILINLRRQSLWEEHAKRFRYSLVPERVWVIAQIPEYDAILDLGCGDGIYFPLLSQKTRHLIGVDISGTRLKRAKMFNGHLVLAHAENLPFRARAFGLVFTSNLVEHIESLRVFNEIERVAESTIMAFMPNPRGPFYRIDATHVLRYTLKSLKDFLTTRREWAYQIKGAGFSTRRYLFKFLPKSVAFWWMRRTLSHPQLAFDIVIIGQRCRTMKIS